MTDLEKPKILEMVVMRINDYYGQPDWLGEYSSKPEEGAIDLWEKYGERATRVRYFNPTNPEYAEQDLERYERCCGGDWWLMGVEAVATIFTQYEGVWLKADIRESLWGIESDCEEALDDAARDMMAQVEHEIKRLGIEWKPEMAEHAITHPIVR